MKDSITSRPLAKEQNMSGEVSGSSGQPMLVTMGESKILERVVEDADVEKKTVTYGQKNKTKGTLSMDPMVESFMVIKGLLGPC